MRKSRITLDKNTIEKNMVIKIVCKALLLGRFLSIMEHDGGILLCPMGLLNLWSAGHEGSNSRN